MPRGVDELVLEKLVEKRTLERRLEGGREEAMWISVEECPR